MITAAINTVKQLTRLQVFRFLIVGFLSFAIEFVLFSFLVDKIGIKYTHANLPAMAAAILFNYFMTRRYVFDTSKYSSRTTFLLFITFTLIGVALNQFFLWFLVEQTLLNTKLSKVVAVILVSVFNFFTKKHFVF